MSSWLYQGFARKYGREIDGQADLYGIGLFEGFLERFDEVCAALQTADDFSRATDDSLVAASDDANVRYREMFFHPMNHPVVPYRTMLDGLVDGIRAAEVDRGVVGRLVPAINRDHSAAAAVELAEEVVAHPRPEVVGIANDYDEEHLPAFHEAHRIAAKGLPGTAHAGEYGSAQSVKRATDLGIHFASIFSWSIAIANPTAWPLDPPLLPPTQRMTSPIADGLAAGPSVSINSVDPAFEGFGSLSDEFVWTAGSLGYDRTQMVELCLAAVEGTWLDDTAKAALRKSFHAEIDQLTGNAASKDPS